MDDTIAAATPAWVVEQQWTKEEKQRASAILDRRKRNESTMTRAELKQVMGK